MILPLIPGITYLKLDFSDQESHIPIYISAIEALKDCHKKGIVVVDLKEDNILYDAETNKSYLIDGGLSVQENDDLSNTFLVSSKEEVIQFQQKYPRISPECWSTTNTFADRAMDVYSLGAMMEAILPDPCDEVNQLIQASMQHKPEDRPTLDELEIQLKLLAGQNTRFEVTL